MSDHTRRASHTMSHARSNAITRSHASLDRRQCIVNVSVAGRPALEKKSQNGERNTTEVMELSTDFLRSVNSRYVLYSWISVCVASNTLSQ